MVPFRDGWPGAGIVSWAPAEPATLAEMARVARGCRRAHMRNGRRERKRIIGGEKKRRREAREKIESG